MPAAVVGGLRASATREHGGEVHDLVVDREAGPSQSLHQDRAPIVLQLLVGGVQNDDRRAVVARLLEQGLRLVDVESHYTLAVGAAFVRSAAQEHARADLEAFGAVAVERLHEFLLA